MGLIPRRIGASGTLARIRHAAQVATEMLEQRRLLSAGDLDPTFGVGGKVVTDLQFPYGGIARNAVVVQADGKIVAVGETTGTSNADFAVVRVHPDGSPDLTFGDGGTVTTDFSPVDSARGVAVQTDGKIVVVGYTTVSSVEKFVLVRYNADGSLDSSFATGGVAIAPFSADAMANAVAIQSDGKILVVGAESNVPPVPGGGSDAALARYNPDGTLDATFGTGGLVSAFVPTIPTAGVSANAVAVQADGKIVIGGMADNQMMLARFDSGGAIDTTFGLVGWGATNITGRLFGVAVQSNGLVVFGGYIRNPNQSAQDIAVGRMVLNGTTTDNSFDGDGINRLDLGTTADRVTGIALQPDGKLVASAIGGIAVNAHLLRYNTNGSLDTTFSGDGIAQLGGGAETVALQPDGGIVIAGFDTGAFRLARFDAGGTLDSTFDGDGIATRTFPGSGNDEARHIAVQQPDGKLVVIGSTAGTSLGALNDFALARYLVDGTLDPTFGDAGQVVTNFGESEIARAVAIQPDGKLVVAGQSSGKFIVVRYNPDGSLDTSFGTGGRVTSFYSVAGNDGATSVAIQPDGKIVAAGSVSISGNLDFGVFRFNADGSPDTSFNVTGKVAVSFGAGADTANGVVLQPDGRIVVGGTSLNDFAIARFNPDGTLDTSFDTDGKVTTPIGTGADAINALALQSDGKIVAAGQAVVSGGTAFALARYLSDGTLDSSFDGDGKVTTDLTGAGAGTADIARGVAVQPNGKILAAGSTGGNFAVAVYESSGALDATFGAGGVVITDFGSPSDAANAVVLQQDGKVIVAGSTQPSAATSNDFALARYLGGNTPPTAVAGGPYAITEGGALALDASGSSDPDPGGVTYAWDLDNDGDFDDAIGATPSIAWAQLQSLLASDDGNATASFTVKVRVDDGQSTSDDSATVTLSNAAPAATFSGGTPVSLYSASSVSFSGESDPSAEDAAAGFTYSYDFNNDGDFTDAGDIAGSASAAASFTYLNPGTYTVRGRVQDRDGGFTDYTTTVAVAAPAVASVIADPVNPTTNSALLLYGSDNADIIIILAGANGALQGSFTGTISFGALAPLAGKPFGRIIVHGNGGNDTIVVATLSLEVAVFAGAGNDSVLTGLGRDILVGGDGNDRLYAGGGNDLIIGGEDADILRGDAGNDALISGTTDYDTDLATLVGLVTGAIPLSSSFMHDDGAADTLTGASGTDRFFANQSDGVIDIVTDQRPTEAWEDLT